MLEEVIRQRFGGETCRSPYTQPDDATAEYFSSFGFLLVSWTSVEFRAKTGRMCSGLS
jgi:hypothetical protein